MTTGGSQHVQQMESLVESYKKNVQYLENELQEQSRRLTEKVYLKFFSLIHIEFCFASGIKLSVWIKFLCKFFQMPISNDFKTAGLTTSQGLIEVDARITLELRFRCFFYFLITIR